MSIGRRRGHDSSRFNIKRSLRDLIIVLLLGYFLVSTFFFMFHKDVLYSVRKDVDSTPGDIDLEFDDLYLETGDGISINAWYVPYEGADLTVLYCHGNGCNMGGSLFYPKMFHSMGLSTFMIDYRGYGRSEGEPTEKGTYNDVEAAWKYMTEDLGKDPGSIIIYGMSLGGAISSHLAPKVSPAAFIMESTFTSFMEQVKDLFFILPLGLIVDLDYPTAENLAKADCPILVIHGNDDVTIQFHHGQDLYDRVPEPKEFLELEGDHNDMMIRSEYEWKTGVAGFIEGHILSGNRLEKNIH